MWADVSDAERKRFVAVAFDFTSDAERYGAAMLRVLDEFPIACQQNLTERAINQQAWIGHAACYLATGCPEYATRDAWANLTDEQKDAANAKADAAIREWSKRHAVEARRVHPQVEIEGLS